MPWENGRHGRPSWIFKIFVRNYSSRDMGLPTLKVSCTSYEWFLSYRRPNFVAKKKKKNNNTNQNNNHTTYVVWLTRAKLFLQAKMKSYNVNLWTTCEKIPNKPHWPSLEGSISMNNLKVLERSIDNLSMTLTFKMSILLCSVFGHTPVTKIVRL